MLHIRSLIAAVLTVALSMAGTAHAARPLQNFNENTPFSTSQAYFPRSLPNSASVWDMAVGSAVTQGSGVVTVITDANGGTSLTTTGGAEPAYQATGLNGKPTAYFDGTDWMKAVTFPGSGDFTITFVHQPDNFFNTLNTPVAGASTLYCGYHTSGDGVDDTQVACGPAGGESAQAAHFSHHYQPEVVTFAVTRTTGAGCVWVNGIKSGCGSSGGAFGSDTQINLGGFGSTPTTFPYKGKISHVSTNSSKLSDANIVNLHLYLMKEYNIRIRNTFFVMGHSGNTGYNITGASTNNSAMSWPYQMRTQIGSGIGVQSQVIQAAIGGSVIEDQDTNATNTIDTMTVPYRGKTFLSIFGCGNNINGGDGSVGTKLQTALANRVTAKKYDNISVIGEMPNFNSTVAANMLSFNAVIRDTPSAYISAGMDQFIDLQTVTNMDTWANFDANARADNVHPTETMAGDIATKVKNSWGL